MRLRLQNRTAVVTGAGSGIGEEIAFQFANEGANVVVVDISQEHAQRTADRISATGAQSLPILCDVSDPDAIELMFKESIDSYGSVDILVNNAGIRYLKSLMDTTVKEWQRTIDVNLTGVFLCTQIAARYMIEQGGGKIINIASVNGIRGSLLRSAYCSSKGGVVMFTRAAALELGPYGIRVNAIAPGAIATPLSSEIKRTVTEKERLYDSLPARREGKPVDISGPAVFLASDESDYIHGEILVVDGGWTARV